MSYRATSIVISIWYVCLIPPQRKIMHVKYVCNGYDGHAIFEIYKFF